LTGSQVSLVQALWSSQLRGVPVQVPAWQVSAPLQALPSLQVVPLGTGVCWQPWTGSQVSAVQGLPSSQLRGGPDVQVPAWQVSAPWQTLPSLQVVPLVTGVCWQPWTGSQVSVVQGLPSSHCPPGPTLPFAHGQSTLPARQHDRHECRSPRHVLIAEAKPWCARCLQAFRKNGTGI
jgi:hypothetical protein